MPNKNKDVRNNKLVKIQEKIKKFKKDPAQVKKILETGAAKAREIADQTLMDAKKKMGLL